MRLPRYYHICLFLIAIICLGASLILTIKDNKATFVIKDFEMNPSICTVKEITNIDCPTCGLSRAFISISSGNIGTSLYYNPSGILLYILFLYQIPYRIYILLSNNKKKLLKRINMLLLIASITVLLINWVYKLITWNFL